MRHSPLNPPAELLAVLDSVVAGIVAVRAQMHALEAAEAMLLQAGDMMARQMASASASVSAGAGAAAGAGGKPTDSALNMAYRAVQTEIGAAVHESDRTIALKMGRATELVEQYPAVYRALTRGNLSGAHANAIVDAGEIIDDEAARGAYEARVLEFAAGESVGRLRPVAKQLAEEHSGEGREERCERARALRRVFVVEREDGMADLTAYLPAPYAYGIKDRLDQMARLALDERQSAEKAAAAAGVCQQTFDVADTRSADNRPPDNFPADNRTADQLRADLLTDMLLTSDFDQLRTNGAPGSNVRARVQVIVPVRRIRQGVGGGFRASKNEFDEPFSGFLDADELDLIAGTSGTGADVATLEGYGPIGDEDATDIAAHATCWEKVSVDADTGTVLTVDTYRPSAAQRRFLGARDLHCRFPGCRASLAWCDIDHTIDAAWGGPTSSDNLGHLCRRHHTLKHATPWTVTQDQNGVFSWVSPTGRTFVDRPESNVRFRAVDEGEGTAAPPAPGHGSGTERETPWGRDFPPLKARSDSKARDSSRDRGNDKRQGGEGTAPF
ncbi:HNH endonuclease signature motif containing protein [Leucobacter salsicius]|uniref:HNH endonuclease signature motif containing protein n=1 Tax=Leucobacter salsicius TaxID=664638 RepID=UPI0018DDBA19|nr:HNH endonuclease signature motif containing protein [Leucobacter salsicius]